ncbi:MAG: hypothetical protein LH606_11170 [Cytophagaceae bacterium]|nr:hypothetical protein [Cytophagaceae bacterium]
MSPIYNETENKVELYYTDGELTDVVFQRVRGKEELPTAQKRKAEVFVREYHEGIVSKWNDVQVYKRKPKFEKITKKTK